MKRFGILRGRYPLPDVLYENYPVGMPGPRLRAKAVKRKIAALGIPVFNPVFFDKASLQNLLYRSPKLRPFLPDCKIAAKPSDVIAFMKLHPVVYFKPVNGFQGKGILEIRALAGGRFHVHCDICTGGQTLSHSFDRTGFEAFLTPLLKKDRYLAQRGLDLLKRDGRKIDFRVMLHRGAAGKWRAAGIRPKLGKRGSTVTNTHAGGTKTTWEELERWGSGPGRRFRRPACWTRLH